MLALILHPFNFSSDLFGVDMSVGLSSSAPLTVCYTQHLMTSFNRPLSCACSGLIIGGRWDWGSNTFRECLQDSLFLILASSPRGVCPYPSISHCNKHHLSAFVWLLIMHLCTSLLSKYSDSPWQLGVAETVPAMTTSHLSQPECFFLYHGSKQSIHYSLIKDFTAT